MSEIPITRPHLSGAEGAAVAEVIASGWISQGPRVAEFEREFAARVGAAEAVATTSCTTALALALHASGVGPGDEVIVPSFSFIATANAVWHCGAQPVFADIDPHTYNLDPTATARAITPATKAIMPVHQLGLPADMDPILALAQRHGLVVVEDAACAIGAEYKDERIGSLETLACFSLHPRKVITTGEGGMIAVQNPGLAEELRRLRAHGMDASDLARHGASEVLFEAYPQRGFNFRMTDMQAALGLCQLRELDWILERRRALAARYTAALESLPCLEAPYDPPYARRTWQSYCARLGPDAPLERIELMRRLLEDGIATRRGVMATHLEASYATSGTDSAHRELPHTEAAARETLLLPLYPDLSEQEQDFVIERLRRHLRESAHRRDGRARRVAARSLPSWDTVRAS
jgi:dTDP-4-amino-4,6-dideoxygalactose transaminase